MNERFQKIARPIALVSIPIWATFSACENGDKKPTLPSNVQSTPEALATSNSNHLPQHRKELLDIAKSTNGGAVFLDIKNYNPDKKLFILVTQLNSQTLEVLVKGATEIEQKDMTGEVIEAGIIINNCANAFKIEISTNGKDFDPLEYTNPTTGIASSILQLDQDLCYTVMPVSVEPNNNSLTPNT